MSQRIAYPMAIFGFALAFIFGWIFPEKWWGTHYLQYLSGRQFAVLIFLGTVVLTAPKEWFHWLGQKLSGSNSLVLTILFLSVGYGTLAYLNPVAYDPYGDAVYFRNSYDVITTDLSGPLDVLLSISLDAWAGEKTILSLVQVISYSFNVDAYSAFRILNAAIAMAYALVWIWFVSSTTVSSIGKPTLIMMGLLSPFALIFFGRTEIYAIPIFLTLLWATQVVAFVKNPSNGRLVMLLLLALLSIKFHPIGLMLLPSSMALTYSHFAKKTLAELGMVRVSMWVLTPIFVAGSVVYFVVLKDHVDDRVISAGAVMQYDHLFLPLFSPDAPRDRYNLFSWNHILDFANILLLISPASLLTLAIASAREYRPSNSTKEAMLIIGISLILYLSLLFVINPILSMPMDWDLYSLPIPLILCLAVLASKELKIRPLRWILLSTILGSGFIVMHMNVNPTAERLQHIGYHVYSSYYEWAGNILNRSVTMRNPTLNRELNLRTEQLDRLEDMAIEEIDMERSALLKEKAKSVLRKQGDAAAAEAILLEAKKLFPASKNNRLILVEAYFEQGKYRLAFHESVDLLSFKAVPKEKTLAMIVQCALEAEMYGEALEYALLSESDQLKEVARRLNDNDRVGELKLIFNKS